MLSVFGPANCCLVRLGGAKFTEVVSWEATADDGEQSMMGRMVRESRVQDTGAETERGGHGGPSTSRHYCQSVTVVTVSRHSSVSRPRLSNSY